jgi:hypothetical protein
MAMESRQAMAAESCRIKPEVVFKNRSIFQGE